MWEPFLVELCADGLEPGYVLWFLAELHLSVAQTRRRRKVARVGASEMLLRQVVQLLSLLAPDEGSLDDNAVGTESCIAAALEKPFIAYQRLRDATQRAESLTLSRARAHHVSGRCPTQALVSFRKRGQLQQMPSCSFAVSHECRAAPKFYGEL